MKLALALLLIASPAAGDTFAERWPSPVAVDPAAASMPEPPLRKGLRERAMSPDLVQPRTVTATGAADDDARNHPEIDRVADLAWHGIAGAIC